MTSDYGGNQSNSRALAKKGLDWLQLIFVNPAARPWFSTFPCFWWIRFRALFETGEVQALEQGMSCANNRLLHKKQSQTALSGLAALRNQGTLAH